MVEDDITASLQGAPVVRKKPAPAKHAMTVAVLPTSPSAAAPWKAWEGIIAHRGPSVKKSLMSSSGGDKPCCLEKSAQAKKSAPVENTQWPAKKLKQHQKDVAFGLHHRSKEENNKEKSGPAENNNDSGW